MELNDNLIIGRVADYGIPNKHEHLFLPGSFDHCLKDEHNIPIWFEHREDIQIGYTVSFESRECGLWMKGILFNTPAGRDVKRLIERGALDSFSMGYEYGKRRNPKDEFGTRTIHQVHRLLEISVVCEPAAPGAKLDPSLLSRKRAQTLADQMDRFLSVKDRLEVPEIANHMYLRWKQAHNLITI